ncbi:glutamyl-tRNA reductase [Methanofollis formosanus]|uniref:Glutamyl-tRNA reductase n=1 Tax=Methanofollis formosanus TaxID=299308 RepID=A0A8G1A4D7_9EURY|nr:glutamyl-tRNA reductase [Methanofollis formosanus]QYZ80365.1 glutamyl-tRNA reductase [Methanofollis formosanus]
MAGLNHHTAALGDLETFRFPDEETFLAAARERFKGALLLQTCNRIEVLVHGDAQGLTAFLHEQGREAFDILEGVEVLSHLLEVAAGIDSMIIGEDQILGQLKRALALAQESGACDPIIDLCIKKAVHVGVEVRRRTEINRGAVSIGSAAVALAEDLLGSLDGRHILVLGSGEMGMLVAKALAARDLTAIYVANRTYERALVLAEKIGGKAVNFSELTRYITLSDVVITCTSAPHPVLTREILARAMRDRCWPTEGHPRPLVVVDIAQPRDVEEGAAEVDGVSLYTIDNLRDVNEHTIETRRTEAARAEAFIEEELDRFLSQINGASADEVLRGLYTWAEAVRTRERDRALARLQGYGPETEAVIDDLSRVLTKKLLIDATFSIRSCAEQGRIEDAEQLVRAITRGDRLCSRRDD